MVCGWRRLIVGTVVTFSFVAALDLIAPIRRQALPAVPLLLEVLLVALRQVLPALVIPDDVLFFPWAQVPPVIFIVAGPANSG